MFIKVINAAKNLQTGKKEVKFNNNVEKGLEIGRIYTNVNTIVTHKGKSSCINIIFQFLA